MSIICPSDPHETDAVQPFPRLTTLTIGKMHYVDLEVEEVKLFRRFFLWRQARRAKGSYEKLHTLRLDQSIIYDLKTTDISQDSVTQVEDFEDDEDYDSGVEDDAMTDGATEFDELPDEEDAVNVAEEAPLDGEEEDELADSDADEESLPSHSSDDSDEDDDEEVEVELQDDLDLSSEPTVDVPTGAAAKSVSDERDELASTTSGDEENFEQWVCKHVEVLESVRYNWHSENP